MARNRQGPRLAEIKAQVYCLASVSQTKCLKASYPELSGLDFRRTTSWQLALGLLQASASPSDEFKDWLANPPDEYRDLFAEINDATASYRHGVTEGRRVASELLQAAEGLEQGADQALQEAQELGAQVVADCRLRTVQRLN